MGEYNIDNQVEFNVQPSINGNRNGRAKNVVLMQSQSTEEGENSFDSIDIVKVIVFDEIANTTVADLTPKEAVIPFSFEEILECKSGVALSALIVERFGEYLFENNMLGETNAIDDDNLLFGDRGKIADSIVYRCLYLSNSGIFGLRRSGKTSVLNAVLRRLDRENIKYVRIESRSDLENLDSWKTALYDISKKIRQYSLSIKQEPLESRVEFDKRLKLNSTEEGYQKRSSQYFVEDVKLYCKEEQVFVIAIDEVELITQPKQKHGKMLKHIVVYGVHLEIVVVH
ncbi:MAG: hypothetical protein ABSC17_08660 [Thermacetogeniaceae bacterium]